MWERGEGIAAQRSRLSSCYIDRLVFAKSRESALNSTFKKSEKARTLGGTMRREGVTAWTGIGLGSRSVRTRSRCHPQAARSAATRFARLLVCLLDGCPVGQVIRSAHA